MDGVRCRALIDTGCSRTLLRNGVSKEGDHETCSVRLLLANGKCGESSEMRRVVLDMVGERMNVQCIVLTEMLKGIDIIVGMDVLTKMGGMRVTSEGVKFDNEKRVGCGVRAVMSVRT